MLQSRPLRNLGPAPQLGFEFGERSNIVTGDNGQGKTILRSVAGEFVEANSESQE
jgi:recombinational DNA repair ATPase RecF